MRQWVLLYDSEYECVVYECQCVHAYVRVSLSVRGRGYVRE